MQFEKYQIRLMEENDASDFYQLVKRNLYRLEYFSGTVSRTTTLEETNSYLKEVMSKIKGRIYYPHVVIDKEINKIIGMIDLKNIDWKIPKAELGCFIDEAYAQKYISYRVMMIFINHVFAEMNIEKLFLRTHTLNIPARKLAEKCGFKTEGILRKDYKTSNGNLVDLVYYGLLKEEFFVEGSMLKV